MAEIIGLHQPRIGDRLNIRVDVNPTQKLLRLDLGNGIALTLEPDAARQIANMLLGAAQSLDGKLM
jgi:hypothetical protein